VLATSRTVLFGIAAVVLLANTPTARSQQISITGNPVLTITTALPGQEPTSVTDATSTLSYRRQTVVTKITVSTSCPGQRFTLKVLAINISGGTAATEVTLSDGMVATDFVTGIPRTGALNKSCNPRYTASATFEQGNSAELGSDIHTVTYTLLAQ
jgi:hypothetical protein